jgi:hypothetical protein
MRNERDGDEALPLRGVSENDACLWTRSWRRFSGLAREGGALWRKRSEAMRQEKSAAVWQEGVRCMPRSMKALQCPEIPQNIPADSARQPLKLDLDLDLELITPMSAAVFVRARRNG